MKLLIQRINAQVKLKKGKNSLNKKNKINSALVSLLIKQTQGGN